MSNFDFRLPDVGEGIAEAEIIEWLVNVGDTVKVDQVVAVIETDKSQIEMPIPVAGVVSEIYNQPGAVVEVGGLLISIAQDVPSSQNYIPAQAAASHSEFEQNVMASREPNELISQANSEKSLIGRVQASPSTRKLASVLGVDIMHVHGSGPHGRITADDVRKHNSVASKVSQSAKPTPLTIEIPGEAKVTKLHGVRRAIAQSMSNSLTIPHILEFKEIDATALLKAQSSLAIQMNLEKVSVTPLLVRACVLALAKHPNLNARFNSETDELVEYQTVRIGIATATDDGLMVPVIANANQLTPSEISREIVELVSAAKARTARLDQLNGGTFTVTNFGSFGTWLGTPVIRHPEVGIAGFGRVTEKVIALGGQPVVKPILPIVVAVDHRINDGAHLGAFTTTLADLLLDAESLVT